MSNRSQYSIACAALFFFMFCTVPCWAGPVRIDWERIALAVRYELQILSSKNTTTTVESQENYWTGDLPTSSYRYRVRALDSKGNHGEWSEYQPFQVKERPSKMKTPLVSRAAPYRIQLASPVSFDQIVALDSVTEGKATLHSDPGTGARLGIQLRPEPLGDVAIEVEMGVRNYSIRPEPSHTYGQTGNTLLEVSLETRYFVLEDLLGIGVSGQYRQEPFVFAPGPQSLAFARLGLFVVSLDAQAKVLSTPGFSLTLTARGGTRLASESNSELALSRGILLVGEIAATLELVPSLDFLFVLDLRKSWYTTSFADEQHGAVLSWLGLSWVPGAEERR